jgi:hypothetical protein
VNVGAGDRYIAAPSMIAVLNCSQVTACTDIGINATAIEESQIAQSGHLVAR